MRSINVLLLVRIEYQQDIADEGVKRADTQTFLELVEYTILGEIFERGQILLEHALGRLGLVGLEIALADDGLGFAFAFALLAHVHDQSLDLLRELKTMV